VEHTGCVGRIADVVSGLAFIPKLNTTLGIKSR